MIPRFPAKYDHSSVFNPDDFISYLKSKKNGPKFELPEKVIFCFLPSLVSRFAKNQGSEWKHHHFLNNQVRLSEDGSLALVSGFGTGAPALVNSLEPMIALGAKQIVLLGIAGSLQHDINVGDIVVCDQAVRDEGCSYHYLPEDEPAIADERLSKALVDGFAKYQLVSPRVPSWTTDAPYRETKAELLHYQKHAVGIVEMELAAAFVVAKYRKVSLGATVVVSDSLADPDQWKPGFHGSDLSSKLDLCLQVGLDTLVHI